MVAAPTAIKADVTILNVPPEVEKKFHELVTLIKSSKSMNTEERQYWVDVLPIMSEDQIGNLRGILTNEKRQIQKASETYSEGMKMAVKKAKISFDEASYREKKRIRVMAEAENEKAEKVREENILKELENL